MNNTGFITLFAAQNLTGTRVRGARTTRHSRVLPTPRH
jgi:hypothetical protein